MITPAERIVLEASSSLKASTLIAKGYNAIQLNAIPNSEENFTRVGLNGTGNIKWKLTDPIIEIDGTEIFTASEKIEIVAGYSKTALLGFTKGTAHGIIKQSSNILSIATDTTKIKVEALEYYILGSRYYQPAVELPVTFSAENKLKVLMINATGLYFLSENIFPTSETLIDALEVGAVRATNGVNIDVVGNSSFFINEVFRNLYIWSKFVKRTSFLTNAALITPNVTSRKLDIQGGNILDPNLNLETIPGATQITVAEVYNVSGIYTTHNPITSYSINVTQYDNGTNLTSIGSNKFTTHTLLRSSRSGLYYLVFGRSDYGTALLAEAEPIQRALFTQGSEIEPIAQIIVSEATASITKIIDVRGK